MPNVDSGFKPPAPKPSPKENAGTGKDKGKDKDKDKGKGTGAGTGTGGASVGGVTYVTKDSTPESVEPVEPKESEDSTPDPAPTPAEEKRVVQPEGLEEYQAIPGKLSTGTAPVFPVREQERKLSAEREDLLRQAAALEAPLGRTVVSTGTEGKGRTVTYETYAPAVPRDDLRDPAPTVGRAAGLDYRAAQGDPRVLQTQPKGSVLSPQTAPDKPVNPGEELSRLNEPAPAFYTGAEAVVPPYSSDVLKQVARRRTADVNADANISIPVMDTHRHALLAELKKPQTPEREAELRRDLERAEAILKQQEAYARALEADGMYQPIEEQQQLAEILLGGSEEL